MGDLQVSCRQDWVDVINDLWPPDSDYESTRDQGVKDMLDAMALEWRNLPVEILQRMAAIQRWRDNHG